MQLSLPLKSPKLYNFSILIFKFDKALGLSPEDYELGLRRREKELRKEFQNTKKREGEKPHQLEIKLKAVESKFANIQQSYKEEKQRLLSALNALEEIKNQLPERQLEEARARLKSGYTEAAEKLFDAAVENGSSSIALASY